MTLLLGIDIGTSSVRALLHDPETARTLAVAGQEYPLHTPAPGRAEQDPEDWWQALVATVRQACAEAGRTDVDAISFSGQMHGTVLLDAQHRVVRPAIIWADQRSAAVTQDLLDTVGTEAYVATTGTLPAAGFLGPTLMWLAREEPESLRRARHVVLPKDAVRLRLTGAIATEPTDAASTGIFDIRRAGPYRWAEEIVAAAGISPALLPPIIATHDVAGELLPEAAEALGLRPGIPVVAGCADQPAQALGCGLVQAGAASVTVGSGGQVFAPLAVTDPADLQTDPRLHVFYHAAPGWYALGAILSAGLSLRWLRGVTGLAGQADAYAVMSEEAWSIPPGADGLLYLPYLNGERTPHMDAQARGAFIGLSSYHTRGHLVRAVMEGVAFALRQALEICAQIGGRPDVLVGSGGGVESPVWRQILTDILNAPLRKSLMAEQAATGAAVLAGIGTGVYGDGPLAERFAAAADRTAHYDDPTHPNQALREHYEDRYEQFCELYPRLREDFHRLYRGTNNDNDQLEES